MLVSIKGFKAQYIILHLLTRRGAAYMTIYVPDLSKCVLGQYDVLISVYL